MRGESKDEKKDRIARERQNKLDCDNRDRFTKFLQTRLEAGINQSLKNWRIFAAVDLAWDSSIISKMTLPLQLYAQGKISVTRAREQLGRIEGGDKFLKKNATGNFEVDVPRFFETSIKLIRSVISRRWSAQKNKYNELWPYYKYEARSTGLPAKCRADVLSQRMDMMTDQFGYRRHDGMVMLDAFLYGHSVDFVAEAWQCDKQYRRKGLDVDPKDVETVVVREGVPWITPHPSRVFYDVSAPLSSINSNTGCKWIGFWDVIRWSDIDDNPLYFNKDRVGWTGRYWGNTGGVYNQYSDYFSHYQYTIMPPNSGQLDPAGENDRKNATAFYSSNMRDASVFVSNYYEEIVPKDWGIGEYPWPVWVRLVTAADSTVIYAEFLPSTPAAYLGINENDSRQVSVSMAMDLLPYEDQMTNLCTHLLLMCQIELFKGFGINTDMFTPEQLKEIDAQMQGKNWFVNPIILKYSLAKLESMGIKVEKALEVFQANQRATIDSIFTAMLRLNELCEKMTALSPAEQGQPAPREISATEVNEISSTTSSIYSSISSEVDDFRSAKKRILCDSTVACSKGDIVCPVKDRYTAKTIQAAGFTPKKGEDEDYVSSNARAGARRFTVVGSRHTLMHDYIFTTRDGSERPVNTQAANTLVQLVSQIMAVPMVAQSLGKEKLYELFNEIFRLSGAGVDLNLTLKEGEDDSLGQDDIAMLKQTIDEIGQYLQKMAGQLQKNSEEIASQDQVNQHQEEAIKGLNELAKRVQTMSEHVDELHQQNNGVVKKLIESLNYKDAPDEIRRQIESEAGFRPAFGVPRETKKANGK